MRLIDRDDLNAIRSQGWIYESTLDGDGQELSGPFVYCVNNRGAWLGLHKTYGPGHSAFRVIPIDSATADLDIHWRKSAELWLQDAPINRAQMLRRYRTLESKLEAKGPREWSRWEDVYHWAEGSDIMWDGLSVHPFITIRDEHELVWTGDSHDIRFREREEARGSR